MDTASIIIGFSDLVINRDDLFSDESITSLPELREKIIRLNNDTDKIAQEINQWYLDHEDIRNEILIKSREIKKSQPSKPEDVENTLQNQCRILPEKIKELEDKKKKK
ncbi:MAG: hypothetical protein ACKO3K_03550 [Cuspidothrix sp.]